MKFPSPRLFALSLAAGVLAGISSALFLYLLDFATRMRQADPRWLIGLPVAGLLIGWCYHRFAGSAARGHNLVLDEIHDPKATLPARMAPIVLGGTLLTHLTGGSAGREGTAVQMGASLADQLARYAAVAPEERRGLLLAGAGAGFGSAMGAPFAGMIFGMEVVRAGKLRLEALLECAVASAAAVLVTHLAHAPHAIYPAVEVPAPDWVLLPAIAIAGALFGLAARLFVIVGHAVESAYKSCVPYPPLRPALGGLLLLALYYSAGTLQFAGLGIETIQLALRQPASFSDPVLKLVFTALTLGCGFKGGEFIPLVFIGTTLGSALAALLGLPLPLFAALGFAAVFGAGANTPIACAVMAAELFGARILPYELFACYLAYLCSGHPGIYRAQPLHGQKHDSLAAPWRRFRQTP